MSQLPLFPDLVCVPAYTSFSIPHFGTPRDLELFLSDLNVVDVGIQLLGDRMQKRPISPNYRGLCPVHNEKTPSFFLRPNQNSFICYGCNFGGHGPLSLAYGLSTQSYDHTTNTFIDDIIRQIGLPSINPVDDYFRSGIMITDSGCKKMYGLSALQQDFIKVLASHILNTEKDSCW